MAHDQTGEERQKRSQRQQAKTNQEGKQCEWDEWKIYDRVEERDPDRDGVEKTGECETIGSAPANRKPDLELR